MHIQISRRWLFVILALFTLNCQIISGPYPPGGTDTPAAGQNSQLPTPPPTARIAFVATGWSVPGADSEIFVMNEDGTGITSISNSRGRDEEPAWSPDGKKIAFVSNRNGNYEVYIMNADGSNQTRLTNKPEDDHYPAWSPDGKQIIFSSLDNAHDDLYVIDVNGVNLTRLTDSPDVNERYPDWSPDGRTIVFSSFGGGDSGIFMMDSDGSNVRLVMAGPLHYPKWSTDGTQIAFDGEPAGCKFEIYIMDADGSNMREITNHPAGCGGYNKHPSWSPDGKKIVYWSSDRDPEKNSENIYIINIDSSDETALTRGVTELNYGGYDPDWSPIP